MIINCTQSGYQHHTYPDVKVQTNSHFLNSVIYPSMAFSIYMISTLIAISDVFMMIRVILCSLLSISLLCCSILISSGIILIVMPKHWMG